MSYRFHDHDPNVDERTITFRLLGGTEYTLGLNVGDTVLDLKQYICIRGRRGEFDGIKVGYWRMKVMMMFMVVCNWNP